jgi:hypothetical protein
MLVCNQTVVKTDSAVRSFHPAYCTVFDIKRKNCGFQLINKDPHIVLKDRTACL